MHKTPHSLIENRIGNSNNCFILSISDNQSSTMITVVKQGAAERKLQKSTFAVNWGGEIRTIEIN